MIGFNLDKTKMYRKNKRLSFLPKTKKKEYGHLEIMWPLQHGLINWDNICLFISWINTKHRK